VEGVSIPHPLCFFANKTKIAVAILDKPVHWENDQFIYLVFLLAISKDDYEEALGIYDFLVEVVRGTQYKTLVSSKN
jgi:activator of the mannose operon, transcriptional antiterminator